MHTTSTPKKLSDLRFQDNVLHLKDGQNVETEARRWFKEVFNTSDPVTCHWLFNESKATTDEETLAFLGDAKSVYECYTDSGSIDYLYIVEP